MHCTAITRTSSLNPVSTFQYGLIAGLLLMAAVFAAPARADEMSLEGQVANARLVGEVTSALSTYAHDVDTLAQNLSADGRARAETTASADFRRLVWYVSALQSSATAPEVDEFANIQDMVTVYGELQGRVTKAANAGDMGRAAQEAAVASAVAADIKQGLQVIADRGYQGLFQTAAARTAVHAAAAETSSPERLAAR